MLASIGHAELVWVQLAARLLMCIFYAVMALGLIKDFQLVVGLMHEKRVPIPTVLLPIAIAVWLGGAAGLLFAPLYRGAVLCLIVLTLLVTVVMHDFWRAPPDQFANEFQHFLKNIAIIAGLLAILGT